MVMLCLRMIMLENFNLQQTQRSLCAQLRTSTIPVVVEVGRLKATPEHLHLCEFLRSPGGRR